MHKSDIRTQSGNRVLPAASDNPFQQLTGYPRDRQFPIPTIHKTSHFLWYLYQKRKFITIRTASSVIVIYPNGLISPRTNHESSITSRTVQNPARSKWNCFLINRFITVPPVQAVLCGIDNTPYCDERTAYHRTGLYHIAFCRTYAPHKSLRYPGSATLPWD